MFWRKFKLDWSYAVGELFIVTVRVLIAIAISAWTDKRLERAEEYDVLSRVISDVELDLQLFEVRLAAIDEKESSLLRVRSALSGGGAQYGSEFLNDVIIGANFGWNQGSAQRATFNDLVGSGRFSVIADPDIRALIVTYYENYETEHVRIDERETLYPHISYQLVLRKQGTTQHLLYSEGKLDSTLTEDEINRIVKAVQESNLRSHLVAEINLARFIRGVSEVLKAKASNLINRLKEYQLALG